MNLTLPDNFCFGDVIFFGQICFLREFCFLFSVEIEHKYRIEYKVDVGSLAKRRAFLWLFSVVNTSYRKIWKLQGNQYCIVKLMLYLNEVLTFIWWLCHEHFFFDWLLKVGKVYLHWSHRMDLRLCAISFEFGNIYLDGFHMIDRKRFRILWTVNLFFTLSSKNA